jgi:O-antigen/teichoic acid export membrane protein
VTGPADAGAGPTPPAEVAPIATSPGEGMARRTALNAGFSAAAQIISKLSVLAWTVVAARTLLQAEFGLFTYVMSIALIAAGVAEWSFDVMLVRRASREHDRAGHYLTEAIAWEAAVGVPLFAAAGVTIAVTQGGSWPTLASALIIAAVFLDMFGDSMRGAAAAVQRQGATSAALVLQRVLTAVFAIPLLLSGAGLLGLGIALVASYAIGLGAHAVAMRRLGVRVRRRFLGRAGMRSFVKGSWTIGVAALVTTALSRIDVVILEAFKGSAEVGAYSAAYKLFDTVLFITFALNGALFPLMSVRADDGAHVRRILESGVAALAFFYLPFAAAVLVDAPGVLSLLFGVPYGETSAGALRWLALAPMVFAVSFVGGSALTAVGRTGGMLVVATVAAVLNVALNLVVVPAYGGTGAALATTLSYLIEAAGILGLVVLVTGQRLDLLRPLVPAAVAAAGLALLLEVSPLPTVVELLAGGVVYVGMWLLVVRWIDRGQVQFVRQALRLG